MTGGCAIAAPRMKIHYSVSTDEPAKHYFRVVMKLEGVKEAFPDGVVRLGMAVWTPGSYLVREFSRNILGLEAADGSGTRLKTEKDAKNSWAVSAGGADSVEVSYRVYAYKHTTNESYLDSWHAMINGASVFLFADGHQNEPCTVEIVRHQGWNVVSTGLEPTSPDAWTFAAPDFDVLVDSPIEVGNQTVHSFEVEGVKHEVAISAPKAIDEKSLVVAINKIVERTVPIFGEIPYKRYVFLVEFTDQGSGGLEHLNSTHCIASYLGLEPPSEYRRMLSLFSHEFFHTWNVKRMRPRALGPFDYTRENYTRSLWVSEGVTSYYENVILRRAGIVSVPEFLDLLCDDIDQVVSLPSSRWQTPQESSFDTWIKFYRTDENTPNVSASYYRQGAVLGTLLDLQIRKSTASAKSLDDVMRSVYQSTYKEGRGFTDEEFETACSEASQGSTEEIFARHVRAKEDIDFQRFLGYAGLALQPKNTPDAPEGFLGIKVKTNQGVTVVNRLFGSPAEAADLSAGDEIIAVEGLRMDAQRLPFYIANQKPGTEITIVYSRDGVLRATRAKLDEKPPFEFRIKKKEAAAPEEKDLYRSWALAEWDQPLDYKEGRVSPARVKILDYL